MTGVEENIEDSTNMSDYLTITALAASTVSFSRDIEFSQDVYNWQTLTAGDTLSLSLGQKLLFKANYKDGDSYNGIGRFNITGRCQLSGNCMSLIFGGKAYAKDSLAGLSYALTYLFCDCTGVFSVLSGFLPAKTLGWSSYEHMFRNCTSLTIVAKDILSHVTSTDSYCFGSMFYGCTSLIGAPDLPNIAYTGTSCCQYMFARCSSLTGAPELPSTSLGPSCYAYMFYESRKLETAPVLPATELKVSCYSYMFYGCSKLNYIKALFTTTPSNTYTQNWVSGVASTGTFVKSTKATWDVVGKNGIPEGWNVEYDLQSDKYCVFIPTSPFSFGFYSGPTVYYSTDNGETWVGLNSDTMSPTFDVGTAILVKSSIHCGSNTTGTGSFSMTGTVKLSGNCMSLKYGDNALDYTTAPMTVFRQLFLNCSAIESVSANFLPATTVSTNSYRAMFRNCTSLKNMPNLPATSIASGCYAAMFSGCSSLIDTIDVLPATTLYSECYSQMFRYCSSITRAPVLPALTLESMCYSSMFDDCDNLSYVKAMFLTTPGSSYTNMWLYGVSSTGTFVKNSSATWNVSGGSGIPYSWTIETATT